MTQVVERLECRLKLGVTSHPTQGSLEDLWYLLDLVAPGKVRRLCHCDVSRLPISYVIIQLGPRTAFVKDFEEPLSMLSEGSLPLEVAAGGAATPNLQETRGRLQNLIQRFFLVRTKQPEAPEVTRSNAQDFLVICPLASEQVVA